MSTERYEIKGKIGEGGVGSVYHAYDTHLNRDVAIKRVLADGGYEDQEEATKSLLKEATALSSVQHPHIVTVYDAGVDDDGPYVVMELIHGRTLDEMVERATLTWDDLREVALQSQEALIAAQDLDLVHRDLKPSNIMVCWLPSGKFQVKIVDFGLAKFSAAPSLQTIAHGDAVFGSIFFMAPEQFERIPLDKCTDMYSMGCLYYYALTGEYPFNGETAAMVMASHLQHHVTPLHELRPDIPRWGADWIMWHIERDMQARPQDARESLGRFLLLDQQSTQPVTVTADNPQAAAPQTGGIPVTANPITAATTTAAGGGQFLFPSTPPAATATSPATGTQAVNPLTAQQTITPPNGALNVHTAPQTQMQVGTGPQPAQVGTAPQFATGPQPAQVGTTPQFATGPQPAQPGTGPQFATGPQFSTGPLLAQPTTAPQQPIEGTGEVAAGEIAPPPAKKGLPPVAKWTIIGLLALVIIVTVTVILSQSDKRRDAKLYKETMIQAKELYDAGKLAEGIKLTEDALTAVLHQASDNTLADKQRALQRAVLAYAKGDGCDADDIIVSYITTADMPSDMRADLLKIVMYKRTKASNIKPLLELARETDKPKVATQAINAARASCSVTAADEYFDAFLTLLSNTDNNDIRTAAEKAAASIIKESSNKQKFGNILYKSYSSTIEESSKYALIRLIARAGGDEAAKVVTEALESDDAPMKNAAIAALGKWTDDEQFEKLISFINDTDDSGLRRKAFDAAYGFLRLNRERDPDDLGDLWRMLAEVAKTQHEKLQIIRGMSAQEDQWAISILEPYIKDTEDLIIDKAEQARDRVERNIRKKE